MYKSSKKLIQETKALCRLSRFLDDCGLGKVMISVKGLKKIRKDLTK